MELNELFVVFKTDPTYAYFEDPWIVEVTDDQEAAEILARVNEAKYCTLDTYISARESDEYNRGVYDTNNKKGE